MSFETSREIENLILDHAWLVDHGAAHRLHELYTDDGKIIGIGEDRVGRAAIMAYGEARAKMTKRVTSHLCSNIRLTQVNSNTVRGHVLVTLFRYDGDVIGEALPIAVGEWTDCFTRNLAGTWKFSERKLRIVFESAAHKE